MSRKAEKSVQRGWGVQVLIVVVFGFLAVSIGWMAAAQIDPEAGLGIGTKPSSHLASPGMVSPDFLRTERTLELPRIGSGNPALGQLTQR